MKFYSYNLRNQNWRTPSNIYDYFINGLGLIDLNPYNINFYSNSLLLDHNNYYCNPPFNNIEPFVDFMLDNAKLGFCSVMLLPIRLNTNWFIKLLNYGVDIIVVGRLNYNDSKSSAPFDSMIINFTGESSRITFSRKYINRNNLKYIQLSIFDMVELKKQ